MKKILLLTVILVGCVSLVLPAPTANGCLRVMTPAELVNEADLIVRAKVTRVDRASFRGIYNQVATLQIDEVIDGDTTLQNQVIRVWAQSRVACASDSYAKGEELLVFLVRETAFYRTLNYQYGQFRVQGGQVLGWRDKERGEIAKTYPEVTTEIRAILTSQPTDANSSVPAATPRP